MRPISIGEQANREESGRNEHLSLMYGGTKRSCEASESAWLICMERETYLVPYKTLAPLYR